MFASRLLGRSAAWLRSGPSRLGATSRPGVAALCAATAAASFTSLAATQYASLEEAPTTPEENQAKEKERLAELARSFAKLDGKPVEVGKTRVLHSKILDEDRLIVISTPTGYDDDEEMAKEKFDVLYVIDPEDHQLTAVGTTHHLAMSEKVPPLVVVGIFNVDRNRDLLPVAKHGNVLLDGQIWEECNSGGAKQFLSFIKEELVPWIESEYRVTQRRTLFGHSFGGLFNLYVELAVY
jgi:enterochelin esterase-like enzyme